MYVYTHIAFKNKPLENSGKDAASGNHSPIYEQGLNSVVVAQPLEVKSTVEVIRSLFM